MRITTSDLYRAVAAETHLSYQVAARAVATLFDGMAEQLAVGQEVRIGGFGKFQVKTLSARVGRHPRSKQKMAVPQRKSISFKGFKRLKMMINPTSEASVPFTSSPERPSEGRDKALPMGRACIRISGIQVCDFPIQDLYGNGSCILVKEQSMIMRNIRIGQEIEIHIPGGDAHHKTVLQRSKITHIIRQGEEDQYPGYVMVGVHVLDRLPLHS